MLTRRDANLRQKLGECRRHVAHIDLLSGESIHRQLLKIRLAQRARIPGEQRLGDALGRTQSGFTVYQTGHFSRQDLLCLGPARALRIGLLNRRDLVNGQESEVAQKAVNIGIGRPQPELIEGIGRGAIGVEPNGAGLGFTELCTIGFGHERQR